MLELQPGPTWGHKPHQATTGRWQDAEEDPPMVKTDVEDEEEEEVPSADLSAGFRVDSGWIHGGLRVDSGWILRHDENGLFFFTSSSFTGSTSVPLWDGCSLPSGHLT